MGQTDEFAAGSWKVRQAAGRHRLFGDIAQTGQPHLIGQPRGVAPTGIDGRSSEPGYSLPDVVHRFKTMTTKKYVDGVKLHGWQRFDGKLWQRNYCDQLPSWLWSQRKWYYD